MGVGGGGYGGAVAVGWMRGGGGGGVGWGVEGGVEAAEAFPDDVVVEFVGVCRAGDGCGGDESCGDELVHCLLVVGDAGGSEGVGFDAAYEAGFGGADDFDECVELGAEF